LAALAGPVADIAHSPMVFGHISGFSAACHDRQVGRYYRQTLGFSADMAGVADGSGRYVANLL
jgi:hypothetical protein